MRRLRDECPWDRQQTHQSLTRYAIEEVYELVEAIGRGRSAPADEAIEEELGDVLLQVFLHSAIAEQEGRFTHRRRRRRHHREDGPPPSPRLRRGEVSGPEQVGANWEAIKAKEKGGGRARVGVRRRAR